MDIVSGWGRTACTFTDFYPVIPLTIGNISSGKDPSIYTVRINYTLANKPSGSLYVYGSVEDTNTPESLSYYSMQLVGNSSSVRWQTFPNAKNDVKYYNLTPKEITATQVILTTNNTSPNVRSANLGLAFMAEEIDVKDFAPEAINWLVAKGKPVYMNNSIVVK